MGTPGSVVLFTGVFESDFSSESPLVMTRLWMSTPYAKATAGTTKRAARAAIRTTKRLDMTVASAKGVMPIKQTMGQTLIGTQGWDYPAWMGSFYPKGTRTANRLAVYARAFPTVEVDSTFYAVPPDPLRILSWQGHEEM